MKSIVTALALCVISALLTSCDNLSSSPNKRIVNSWLTDLEKGGDDSIYWSSYKNTTKFYAVRDWKILKEESKPFGDTYESHVVSVRIDSSNKGGIRITKIWDVEIFGGEIWEISEN